MPINFPSNSTPYTGNSQAGESPETTLPKGTGKVRPGEIAAQDALTLHRATSTGSSPINWEGFSQRLFGAGGQVPLELPPPPPSAMSVQKSRESLVAKFAPLMPDTDRDGNKIDTSDLPTPTPSRGGPGSEKLPPLMPDTDRNGNRIPSSDLPFASGGGVGAGGAPQKLVPLMPDTDRDGNKIDTSDLPVLAPSRGGPGSEKLPPLMPDTDRNGNKIPSSDLPFASGGGVGAGGAPQKLVPLMPDTDRNGNKIPSSDLPPANRGGQDDDGGARLLPKHFYIDDVLHLLLTTSVQEFQEAQLESREDTQEKMSDMDTAAADIKAGAKKRLAGAIAAGSGGIVAGALSIAGAGINLRGGVVANKSLDALEVGGEQGLNVNTRPMAFQSATYGYSGAASAIQGTGQGLQGGMGILQAKDEEHAAGDDADKEEADKAAVDDDALHETAASQRQEFLSVMQDYLDKEKGWEQSQDQTMMTLARNV